MEVLYPRCCGIDVHKTFIVACLLMEKADGQKHKETRRFGTMTDELVALAEWLRAAGCTTVAMESSGVFWKPVYNLLEGRFEVLIVNAQHMKAVPGRKTDKNDAEWIADLLQHGLLKPSFIPNAKQRQLRDLTRYRTTLIQGQNRHINRLHKVLEDANLKLSSVVTDVMGVTGRAILQALVAGQEDAEQLAKLARGSLRRKQQLLAQALRGHLKEHHRFMLKELLDMITFQEKAIDRLDREIAEHLRPFEETIARIDEVTGLSRRAIEVLLAEIGTNMDQFPSAAHVSSWVGICPGNYESGGKRLSGKIRKGNRWVKTVLVQAAHATSRTDTYLGEQYRRLAKRRGSKKAAIAVGHSILVIVYQMLKTGQAYQEKGATYFDELDQQRVQRQLVKRLERMGYQVTLQPTASLA
jgi:transposase